MKSHPNKLIFDYLCKDPLSKLGHILRYWGLSLPYVNLETHNSTYNTKYGGPPRVLTEGWLLTLAFQSWRSDLPWRLAGQR